MPEHAAYCTLEEGTEFLHIKLAFADSFSFSHSNFITAPQKGFQVSSVGVIISIFGHFTNLMSCFCNVYDFGGGVLNPLLLSAVPAVP